MGINFSSLIIDQCCFLISFQEITEPEYLLLYRVIDAKAYEKLHRVLVTNLGKCAISLVREAERFDGDFVLSFCDSTVKEHYKSALSKDRIYKVTLVLKCLTFLMLLFLHLLSSNR